MEESAFGNGAIQRLGPGEAIRRHWFLALLPLFVLVAAAVGLGLQRTPTYTADSKMIIGRIDVTEPGALTGFSTATQALASAYSRAIDADQVVNPIAQRLHASPVYVRDHITASPIPDSPVFRIEAIGPSALIATRLANAGSQSLLNYITQVNSSNPARVSLYSGYKKVAFNVAVDRGRVQAADKKYKANPTNANAAAVARENSRYDADRLRADVLRANYTASYAGGGTTSLVQTLSRASVARSDRASRLEIYVFAAVVAGTILGAALALWRANRALLVRARRMADTAPDG